MENNINTVTTANYSACSGEQPEPDGTITSTQVYSSHALNGTIKLNILPTENMEVLCWVFSTKYHARAKLSGWKIS